MWHKSTTIQFQRKHLRLDMANCGWGEFNDFDRTHTGCHRKCVEEAIFTAPVTLTEGETYVVVADGIVSG